jgi:hypothetical protein
MPDAPVLIMLPKKTGPKGPEHPARGLFFHSPIFYQTLQAQLGKNLR